MCIRDRAGVAQPQHQLARGDANKSRTEALASATALVSQRGHTRAPCYAPNGLALHGMLGLR
eukprot:2647212-Lingulodinium_polyedra.AAC.1